MSFVFPKHVPHKLHMVTLVRSKIRRPHWERRILVKYGLNKTQRTVILKNTAQVNADLKEIREIIEVRPIRFNQEPDIVEQEDAVFTDVEERRADLAKLYPDYVKDIDILAKPFLDSYGNFDAAAYEKYVADFPEERLDEKLSKNHIRFSELLNHDFVMEEEAKISDKEEKINLYFKKDTWKNPTSQHKRTFRKTKY